MINRVVLVGRLTKDPELKYTPSGVAMVRFTLAVSRTFSNAQGEREADFVSCIAWRKQAENTANYLKKGSLAGVDGRIQTGSYEGTDGKRIYTTDVVADSVQFLEPKSTTEGRESNPPTNTPGTQYNGTSERNGANNYTRVDEDPFSNSSGPVEIKDDDLPF